DRRWLGRRAGGLCRGWGIDPDRALPFDARIGAAADLAEIDFLSLAQRGNLDAGAAHVEAPAVVAARDGLAVEPAVMKRDAAVGADVAQRKNPSIAPATDEQRFAEQRLVHEPPGAHVGAHERDVPHPAKKFGFKVVHGLIPGGVGRPGRYVGTNGRSVSPGLPPACVSMQCTWPRWCVWWLNICVTRSHFGLRNSRLAAPEE